MRAYIHTYIQGEELTLDGVRLMDVLDKEQEAAVMVCMHTYIHTYIHTHTHTCVDVLDKEQEAAVMVCMHTYIHTYTQTHMRGYA